MTPFKGNVKKIVDAVKVTIEYRTFFSRCYLVLSKNFDAKLQRCDPLTRAVLEEHADVSHFLDKTEIQESCTFRNCTRARNIAIQLIDDNGKIDREKLEKAVSILEENLFTLGPGHHHDAVRNKHILKVLKCIRDEKLYTQLLKRSSRPLSHKFAEQIIRETLHLSENEKLTDAHTRRAVLAAWMTYLRQNVGSCFATAPAIIIQSHQPERFLEDMAEMIATGRLKRTFSGVEYSVPLSQSWGIGDLRKPFVLNSQFQIGKSPGFLEAFKAADLIKKSLSKKKAYEKLHKLIFTAYHLYGNGGGSFIVCTEDVIKKVLMDALGVTEEKLQDYELRPTKMFFARTKKGADSETERCKRFYDLCEKAKRAFISFTDNALLKAWEFTVASFTETKAEFSRWNLYASLGLNPDDKDGIGNMLYNAVKEKLELCNEQVHEITEKYDQIFTQVKYLEARLNRASKEEARWMRNDYQVAVAEMNNCLKQRNLAHYNAKRWANMYNFLIDYYSRKFREYFQEVYDADIHDVSPDPYDDSPAGFRLVYKHGRSNTSLWTQIKDHNQFIDFLAEFFNRTESDIINLEELKGLDRDLIQIISNIVNQIRTDEFLESALYRMVAAHGGRMVKNPLQNLNKIDKKPWVYTSGGTMNNLVSVYYCREQLPREESKWVESPTELMAFFIDTVKAMPRNDAEKFIDHPSKSLLVHSPTHAFLLQPGYKLFKEGWRDSTYTYTWIRDNYVIPRQHFLRNIKLDTPMQQELIAEMARHIIEPYRHVFKKTFHDIGGERSVDLLRKEIIDRMTFERGLQVRGQFVLDTDDIDSILYKMLPMFHGHKIAEVIEEVVMHLNCVNDDEKKKMLETFKSVPENLNRFIIVNAKRLREIIASLVMLVRQRISSPCDHFGDILQACRKVAAAPTEPFIFADTNWTKDYFSFVVNPGNLELELWRTSRYGCEGVPMLRWKKWMDGSFKKPNWGVYTQAFEYGE